MPDRGKIQIDGLSAGEETETTAAEDPASAKTSAATESDPSSPYEPPSRRPKSERKDAFDLGAWLVEGVLGIAEEVRHHDLGLPEEFWIHAYAARREALLAARALIDTALEHCEREESTSSRSKSRQQRGNVTIDFG